MRGCSPDDFNEEIVTVPERIIVKSQPRDELSYRSNNKPKII